MNKLNTGSRIPEFELPDQHGNLYRLQDVIGKKNLVIYFYPKDETAGCTAQACSFRDDYEDFLHLDAEVIGISEDSPESHRQFAGRHQLPFVLLSDKDNKARELFGVPRSFLGLIPGRTTYIVDKQGIIRHVFNSQLGVRKHVSEALDVLKKITRN